MVEHSEPDIKNLSVTEEKGDVKRFETVSFGKASSQGAEREKRAKTFYRGGDKRRKAKTLCD